MLPKKSRVNRQSYAYRKQKAEFLKKHGTHNGFWLCWECLKWTDTPELDHKHNTGMGGSPSRLMDISNWQLLCGRCHGKKHGVVRG